MNYKWLLLAVVLMAGCKKLLDAITSKFTSRVVIQDTRLKELSGIAASIAFRDILYVHNDSGDSSRFFALSTDGELRGICYFTGDPHLAPLGVKDCEDIAVSIGPDAGASYVYMGDIGDNDAVRKLITIYRINESSLSSKILDSGTTTMHVGADPLFLRYPDGAHDAETLLADPIDKLLYIVTKREDSVSVYSTPLNFKPNDTLTLTWRTKLFFQGSGKPKWITAGDVSQDGQQLLLKSYTQVYYWKRKTAEAVWQTLQQKPSTLTYEVEPQGEAIGFSHDGGGYYTVSEGVKPGLYFYEFGK